MRKMRYMLFLFTFAMLVLSAVFGCQGAINDPLAALAPTYATAAPKTSGPLVSIVTTGFTDGLGDFREPFSVKVLPDGRIAVSVTLINTGDAPLFTGNPLDFPERYVNIGGKWNLVGLLSFKVTTMSGDPVVTYMPLLYDVGDIFPITAADKGTYTEMPYPFTGFVLTNGWGNPLTENNVGAVDQPAGTIVLPSGTPAGTYKVEATVDPNFWYGINSNWSGTFTTDGTTAVLKSALKRTGKK